MKRFSDFKVNYLTEEWAPCPKAPDYYDISTSGQLFSRRSQRIVRLNSMNGYAGHVAKIGGRLGYNLAIKVHIEVATAFIWNPDPDFLNQVNHIDGDKFNANWWNLEWSNQSMNTRHAILTGLQKSPYPTPPPRDKILTDGIFSPDEILYMVNESKIRSLRSISREFNINHKTISLYIRRWYEFNK